MTKRKNPYPETSIQGIITELLREGPLVGFYFSVAIILLKQHADSTPDEELVAEFGGLLSAERIRHNVNTMAERLNRCGEKVS